MGIGAAWNEEESRAYGITFPSTGLRFLMLEVAIHIIRMIWDKKLETMTFDGRSYKLRTLSVTQIPFKNLCLQYMIGGSGEKKSEDCSEICLRMQLVWLS